MKTGIFGGTFNPIHNGHIALARTILKAAELDEVWFVVSPQNPWKQNHILLNDDKRLEMVRAALNEEPHLIASDFEFHLPRPSYMWNTLQAMSKEFPDREFTLLIGGDNWDGFDRWYQYEDILDNYNIIVYPREGKADNTPNHSIIHKYTNNKGGKHKGVRIINTPLLDISSTQIRERISNGESFSHLVPPAATEIILRDNLYM